MKTNDAVDLAAAESFPASDPPAWTATIGAGDPHEGKKKFEPEVFVEVESERAEELQHHLASHGVGSLIKSQADRPKTRLEIEEGTDLEMLQAILDLWEN